MQTIKIIIRIIDLAICLYLIYHVMRNVIELIKGWKSHTQKERMYKTLWTLFLLVLVMSVCVIPTGHKYFAHSLD
jgi:nitrogen fixation/metabolism regulation signal transduction histidine kinase